MADKLPVSGCDKELFPIVCMYQLFYLLTKFQLLRSDLGSRPLAKKTNKKHDIVGRKNSDNIIRSRSLIAHPFLICPKLKENSSQLNNCYNSIHCNFLFVNN